LSKLREKRASRALMTEARQLKAAYQFHRLKPPDWLRGFRATPLAKFDVTTGHKNRPNL
jgi:hypothetical protein